ncbi:proto-oncogene Mas-like [Hyla sarda]|uniref:proto-oncogene Mas-like n=1 Tax=Hyla sarda TaxID=327740 RepID=UPI0024C41742|nr:proto-oncogene Mas-like [Hyla sarda]XP_056391959.1 proto-oncogene Mas-like [Hyla sarda]XP_056391960.1 proto-oncogene Mas-like [Hyla sarda]XP_056391961.1 proto-oncogene Mas-like [Hyla sarda]
MSLNTSMNNTNPPVQVVIPDMSLFTVPITICLLTVLICLVGLVGNGITIYLFCFRLKLNQSTVYILNLAMADFIFVFGCCMVSLYFLCVYNRVPTSQQSDTVFSGFGEFLNSFGFNSSLFFLAILSIERCLSVCFPIWYKCRRPEHLSAILCGIIWIISVFITVLERFLIPESRSTVYAVISVIFLIVTLFMFGSSAVLLIEIQKTSIQCRPIKLYIVVVSAVITFLISLVPATMVRLLFFFSFVPTGKIKILSYIMISLCSAINSTVNPYIYIIVGRWRKNVPTAKALESVFKEEHGRSSEGDESLETQQTDTEPKPNTLSVNRDERHKGSSQ